MGRRGWGVGIVRLCRLRRDMEEEGDACIDIV